MRGRLAPSPTGALHLGNARTFLVAWLDARARGGGWSCGSRTWTGRGEARRRRGGPSRPLVARPRLGRGPGPGRALRALRADREAPVLRRALEQLANRIYPASVAGGRWPSP